MEPVNYTNVRENPINLAKYRHVTLVIETQDKMANTLCSTMSNNKVPETNILQI